MTFYVSDFVDWCGELYLSTADNAHEEAVDVWEFWDEDEGDWRDDAIRSAAESQVKERYGADAVIAW